MGELSSSKIIAVIVIICSTCGTVPLSCCKNDKTNYNWHHIIVSDDSSVQPSPDSPVIEFELGLMRDAKIGKRRLLTESEPEAESTAENGNVTAESEGNSDEEIEAEPESESEAWAEPGPEWENAFEEWQGAWEFHIYFFASMFTLIGLACGTLLTFQMAQIIKFGKSQASKKILTLSMYSLLVTFGLSRGISLFIDPYSSKKTIPGLLQRLLWSLGNPCITSAFSNMLLVLLDTTRLSVEPPKYQRPSVIIILTFSHFFLVMGADILVSLIMEAKSLLLLCQLIFSLWGALLSVGYFYVFYKMHMNLKSSSKFDHVYSAGARSTRRIKIIIVNSGVMGLLLAITNLYGTFGVVGIYSGQEFAEPWPWWAYQFLLRLEEVSICFLITAISLTKADRSSLLSLARKAGLRCCRSNRVGSSESKIPISTVVDPSLLVTIKHSVISDNCNSKVLKITNHH